MERPSEPGATDQGPSSKQVDKRNGFGALRLLFASLVILAHAPEILDGDKSREILTRIFGQITFGALAVDGFFLISGYLIAASFVANPRTYLWKRVLRIYPAYIVCSLICIFVVAPLAGADLGALSLPDWIRVSYRLAMLKDPEVAGAYDGMKYTVLNGSMWTISYEFRCYLLAALFGIVGLYRRPRIFLALTGALLFANLLVLADPVARLAAATPGWVVAMFGYPPQTLRLLSIFMVGTCFRLCPPPYRGKLAIACGLLLLPLQFLPVLGEIALVTLGGYVLFWAALTVKWRPMLTLNAKDDISYGVYLYAWPITALTIWWWRGVPLVPLILITLALSCLCGWVSWKLIEQPTLRLKRYDPLHGIWRPAAPTVAE